MDVNSKLGNLSYIKVLSEYFLQTWLCKGHQPCQGLPHAFTFKIKTPLQNDKNHIRGDIFEENQVEKGRSQSTDGRHWSSCGWAGPVQRIGASSRRDVGQRKIPHTSSASTKRTGALCRRTRQIPCRVDKEKFRIAVIPRALLRSTISPAINTLLCAEQILIYIYLFTRLFKKCDQRYINIQ